MKGIGDKFVIKGWYWYLIRIKEAKHLASGTVYYSLGNFCLDSYLAKTD